MRFHPMAVLVVVGSSSSSSIADAFVLPKSGSTDTAKRRSMTSPATTTKLVRMAANKDEYASLEDNLFNGSKKDSGEAESRNTSDSAENPSTQPKKPKKPNPRTERLRSKLEADLAAAEESRERTAQQLADAESSRLALETEAAKAAKEAAALEAKFQAFEAKEAARAAAGGGLGAAGIAGEIAGPLVGGIAAFGGLAAARDSLAARSEKAEEERLQREEAERKAEEAAKRKAAQKAQTKNLLPFVGAGAAGLGAFGAFFGSGSSGGGGDTVVDAIKDAASKQQSQQINAGSVTTAVPDPSASVNLPYLDKEIAKAETKQNKKEIQQKPQLKRPFGRQATEEQKAVEARLEQKLAEAPEIARKAAEAEAKAAEEDSRIEAERKVAEEKAAEEAAIAAEKAKAEKITADKLAFEKLKSEEEKAKVEKIAAEQKRQAEEKAKVEKIAADKVAFEKLQAEEKAKTEEKAKVEKIAADKLKFEKLKAEEKAKAERKAKVEEAAAVQLLKQQEAQSQGFFPKVPAVSEMLFGNMKSSEVTDKGLSNIFNPTRIVVGGVALVGTAVASAIIAANDPSVSSTFKVTGKSPKQYLESGDTDASDTSAPKKTIHIPQPGKPKSQAPPDGPKTSSDAPKTSPSPGSKEALREELAKKRDDLNKQAAEKASRGLSMEDISSSPPSISDVTSTDESIIENTDVAGPAFVPSSTKNSFSPFRGGKPKAVANDSLYSPPAFQVEEDTPASASQISDTRGNTPPVQPVEPTPDQNPNQAASSVTIPKSSYSPFGGGKPKAVANDSLYSPPASASSILGTGGNTPPAQPIEPTPDQSAIGGSSFVTTPKSSYSPFGGGKAVANDSLYSPPASVPSIPETGGNLPPAQPIQPTPDKSAIGGSSFATTPKSSYSPFGGGKPKAALSDSLYSPPASQSIPDSIPSTNVGDETPASTMDSDFSSFEESYPDAEVNHSSESAESPHYEPVAATLEESSFAPIVSAPPPKNYYSPFGARKPVAVTDTSIYTPPTNDQYNMNQNEEESLPFAASGLDETSDNTAVPESTAFRASSVKRSFSPFGSKPKAPSNTSGDGSGYLDGL